MLGDYGEGMNGKNQRSLPGFWLGQLLAMVLELQHIPESS